MTWLFLLFAGSLTGCSLRGESTASRADVSQTTSVPPDSTPPRSTLQPAPPSAAYVEVKLGGVVQMGVGHAMLLVHEETRRAIPVFLGGTEGLSIELRLEGRRYPRPLTHDLLDSTLVELGATIHSARVEKIESNVFFGTLVLSTGGRTIDLDARTSDAVAMAIGSGAPIFVARDVLDNAGISMDTIEPVPPMQAIPKGIPL